MAKKKNKQTTAQGSGSSTLPTSPPVSPAVPLNSAPIVNTPPTQPPNPAVSLRTSTVQATAGGEKDDWHKPAVTYIALIGLAVALIGTGVSTYFSYLGFNGLQTQIRLQRESQDQSLPVDFRLVQQVSPDGEGMLKIRNAGAARLEDIESRIRFFFAFPDGRVMTVAGLAKFLGSDTNALEKCQKANLLLKAEDVTNLIEPPRRFSVSRMSPSGVADGSDEFSPEVSPSSVLNSLRLAHVLGARVVLRCRFEYQHHVSHQVFSRQFHILVLPLPDGDVLKVRPQEVIDLSKTLGGKAIVDAVAKVEETSQEVTFSNP
jgi:hypothetical protein